MQLNNKLSPQPLSGPNNGGYIMVIVVLVLATVVSIILVQTAITSLGELTVSDVSLNGKKAYVRAAGCLEEGMLQVHRYNDYAGGTVILPEGECTLTISGDEITKNILASVILDNYQVVMEAEVTLDPFELVSWGKVN